jgi:ABC-type dipeptide/oligopeptide/nickel transport system ATPase component
MTPEPAILSVRNLIVDVPSAKGMTRLLDGVSFDVYPNEVLGLVGESGSGKSLTMLAVMGLWKCLCASQVVKSGCAGAILSIWRSTTCERYAAERCR